jgi:hypothetical protein
MIGTFARQAASALFALLISAGAEAKPAVHTPSKPVNEAARQEGDKLIATAGAPDLFLNETRDGAILIRHRASNFQCLFSPGAENALLVPSDAPRGDDIGGDGPTTGLFQTTYFIKRAGSADTLDTAMKSAVDEVKGRWPDAMTIRVGKDPNQEVLSQLAVNAPPSKTQWFLARNGESWAFTRISVARVGDWMITMRAAGPVESQDAAESLSEMLWITRLMVMTDPSLAPKPLADAGHKRR